MPSYLQGVRIDSIKNFAGTYRDAFFWCGPTVIARVADITYSDALKMLGCKDAVPFSRLSGTLSRLGWRKIAGYPSTMEDFLAIPRFREGVAIVWALYDGARFDYTNAHVFVRINGEIFDTVDLHRLSVIGAVWRRSKPLQAT